MLKLFETASYKKQLKKYKHQKQVLEELSFIVEILLTESPVPPKYRNHKLKGSHDGLMELHLRPDDLLIYLKVDKYSITLVAIGNHAELFG